MAELEKKFKETEQKKAVLENNTKLCEDRMDRAFRLIHGLADEKDRWIHTVEKYKNGLDNIIGDILICSGKISLSKLKLFYYYYYYCEMIINY